MGEQIEKTKVEVQRKQDAEYAENSPANMIRLAISGGAGLDQVEKLIELQERWEANEAKKAYHKAMSQFKEKPLKIVKDKHVKFATTKGGMDYHHASLANVVETITTELGKHGLSASWKTQQNGQIVVTCRIVHMMGHSEETTLSAGADNTGLKNSIQAMGSTITYLQRYTLLSALGLATHDQDDDAKMAVPVVTIDEKQLSQICDMVNGYGVDLVKFLTYMRVGSLEEIPKKDYQTAINALKLKEKESQ